MGREPRGRHARREPDDDDVDDEVDSGTAGSSDAEAPRWGFNPVPDEDRRARPGKGDGAAEEPAGDRFTDTRGLRIRIGAVACVVLAAIVTAGLLAGGRPVAPGAGIYNARTTDPYAAAQPLLQAAVEAARGQRFRRPVPVRIVSARGLTALRRATLPVQQADRAATARALGVTQPTTPAIPAGTAQDTDGYYSFTSHTIYLRRTPFDAYHRAVFIHQLTHALDDQRYDLAGLIRAAAPDADRLRGAQALIEGDAARVEQTYIGRLPVADQRDIRRAHNYTAPATTYAENERAFSLTQGSLFVLDLLQLGGEKSVDQAFAHPPTSSQQIALPRYFAGGREPLGVRPPTGAGTTIDEGSLGVFGLATFLTGGVRYENVEAVNQWRGDRYRTVRTASRVCVTDTVLLGDATARDELAAAIRTTPGFRGPVTTSQLDPALTFTSCR